MARTKYQRLQKAKASYCAGRIKKSSLTKAKNAYITDAVKKGNKTRAEATASANKVVNRGCGVGIAGTKKRKSTKKRRTRKK